MKGVKQMKIKYQFADETVEIEVSDEWGNILIDLDRQEYNNDHKETRRHYHFEACAYEGATFAMEDENLHRLFEDDSLAAALPGAIAQLQPQQRDLLRRIYKKGEKLADVAREEGISKAAVTRRLQKIYAILQKKLSQGG